MIRFQVFLTLSLVFRLIYFSSMPPLFISSCSFCLEYFPPYGLLLKPYGDFRPWPKSRSLWEVLPESCYQPVPSSLKPGCSATTFEALLMYYSVISFIVSISPKDFSFLMSVPILYHLISLVHCRCSIKI